jgi:type II secretory pathway pseudopilin PulG
MGQQQLLLVILVTIIVGIATVVAINTFGTAADQANIDAVNNDIATLASAAQGYFMRPQMLGGGGRSFVGLTFQGLAFPATFTDDDVAVNENGRYELDDIEAGAFTITAFPASSDGYVSATDPNTAPSTGGVALTAGVGPNTFVLGGTAATIAATPTE